jgi:hypothetical protein
MKRLHGIYSFAIQVYCCNLSQLTLSAGTCLVYKRENILLYSVPALLKHRIRPWYFCRVDFYSGMMKIISAPGKGCIIEIRIPLPKNSGYE